MFEWISAYETELWWLTITSVLLFVVTLFALPLFLIRIPADHFLNRKADVTVETQQHPGMRWMRRIAANLFGAILILAGIAMLVLPGQGLLTILIGLLLVDFPGKQRALHWLVAKPAVRNSIDRLRRKAGRPPLVFDD